LIAQKVKVFKRKTKKKEKRKRNRELTGKYKWAKKILKHFFKNIFIKISKLHCLQLYHSSGVIIIFNSSLEVIRNSVKQFLPTILFARVCRNSSQR
jgi:hypothetical protein